jgi:hypothetical protein
LREKEAMRLVAVIALVSAAQAIFCQPGRTPALCPGLLLTAGSIAQAAFRELCRRYRTRRRPLPLVAAQHVRHLAEPRL